MTQKRNLKSWAIVLSGLIGSIVTAILPNLGITVTPDLVYMFLSIFVGGGAIGAFTSHSKRKAAVDTEANKTWDNTDRQSIVEQAKQVAKEEVKKAVKVAPDTTTLTWRDTETYNYDRDWYSASFTKNKDFGNVITKGQNLVVKVKGARSYVTANIRRKSDGTIIEIGQNDGKSPIVLLTNRLDVGSEYTLTVASDRGTSDSVSVQDTFRVI